MATASSWRAIALVIGALALVPVQAVAAERALARLAFSSGWDGLAAVVAIERGFFDQEGLVISGLASSSPLHVINSLTAGSTDFAAVPQRTLLVMAALRSPVKVISTNGWGTEIELMAPKDDTATKSVADLKGKVIGVGVGSETYPVLIRLLNKAKIRPNEVTIKTLSAPDLTRAFQKKLAGAILESRYLTSALAQTGQGRTVLTHQDIVKTLGLIGAGPLVARQALIEKEPGTVQRFVNAWIKALTYIQQDPEDAGRMLQVFFHRQGAKVSEEMARAWIGMARYDRYVWSPAEIADAEFNGWGLKEGGVLKVLPKLDAYVENRFARKAVESLQSGSGAPSKKAPARSP
jgi:ABC-type nitrate/sulfonate/bicarbonate transport system substrate-binding protein